MLIEFSEQILILYKKQQRLNLSATLKVSIFLNCYFKFYIDNLLKCSTIYYTHKADYYTAERHIISWETDICNKTIKIWLCKL